MYKFLTTLNFSPDIVCLTETRIKSQPLINVEIANYNFVHVDSESAAGGVVIYVSDRIQCELWSNQYHLTGTECLWLNTYESNSKKIFTVSVAKEPGKFFLYSLKVQEHSLTINSNLFFPVVKLPRTQFLHLNTRLTPNITIDLSLTTNNLNTML